MNCIANDKLNCKYCKIPKAIRLCEEGQKLTQKGRSKAADIMNQCGGKHYYAVAQVSDMMLRDAIDMKGLQRHIVRQLGSNLAHALAENMPENMVVQRKDDPRFPFYAQPGVTEYRAEVVVFSRENFDKFVETLLNQFGDEYATAALATKKNNLKKTIAAAVDKA